MELRHLRYFIAVAEELHFTRAAHRLGISQPPLSAQIRQLEEEVGTQLFRRLSRGVELTEAGQAFLEEARLILEHVDRAKLEATRRARGEAGRLRIGFASAVYLAGQVPGIVMAYRRAYPDVTLVPVQASSADLATQLQEGELDLAFTRMPEPGLQGIATLTVADEDVMALLPAHHALAHAPSIPLAALAEELFIMTPRGRSPGFFDHLIAGCRAAGFEPKLGFDAPFIDAVIAIVGMDAGVSLVPRSISNIKCELVVYVPLTGTPLNATVDLVYRHGDSSRLVRNLVSIARKQRKEAMDARKSKAADKLAPPTTVAG